MWGFEEMKEHSLGNLAVANCFHEPISIKRESALTLISYLKLMLLIRSCEEKIGDEVTKGNVHCPCHLAIGQEAIAVGVSKHLKKSDYVFGTHRSHAHYLAMGGSLRKLFAEVLGRASGCSLGMGGSMHLFDASHGFMGSVPIVSATIPIAVGAGLASKMAGGTELKAGVCYFGDGASEEGSLHESLNFAKIYQLPVFFICENNLFSSHLHIRLRQPADSIARFAEAHQIKFEVIDGNNVVEVAEAASRQ